MITTITINPALDIYSQVEKVIPDKKLRCRKAIIDPGGGGVNVSRVIKRLGGESTAIYTCGGYTGDVFQELLKKEGVRQDVVEVAGGIRENFAVTESATGALYRFGFPGAELSETEVNNVIRKLNLYKNDAFWVASGSLPPGAPDDFYARIAAKAKKENVKFVLDTSGKGFTGVLEEGAFLLKPNKKELEELVGVTFSTEEDQKELLLEVLQKYPVEAIVMSMGAKGALLAKDGEIKNFPAPKVEHISSIGAGDSLVAGIVYMLSKGNDMDNALLYGLACGSATIKSQGTELLTKEDVTELYQRLTTE